jgi:hypothetical protein
MTSLAAAHGMTGFRSRTKLETMMATTSSPAKAKPKTLTAKRRLSGSKTAGFSVLASTAASPATTVAKVDGIGQGEYEEDDDVESKVGYTMGQEVTTPVSTSEAGLRTMYSSGSA